MSGSLGIYYDVSSRQIYSYIVTWKYEIENRKKCAFRFFGIFLNIRVIKI